MKIVFTGPGGQLLSVEDTRTSARPGKAITTLPVDRRPAAAILGVFRD